MTCVFGGEFLEPSSPKVFVKAEGATRLPCQLNIPELELKGQFKFVQVSWTWKDKAGTKKQIITAHHIDGILGMFIHCFFHD